MNTDKGKIFSQLKLSLFPQSAQPRVQGEILCQVFLQMSPNKGVIKMQLLNKVKKPPKGFCVFSACCCCSFTKSCLTLRDPVDCSTPGFPVLHRLPEFAQDHVCNCWWHPTIPSPVTILSFCLQSFQHRTWPKDKWPRSQWQEKGQTISCGDRHMVHGGPPVFWAAVHQLCLPPSSEVRRSPRGFWRTVLEVTYGLRRSLVGAVEGYYRVFVLLIWPSHIKVLLET